jgi:hypothetical protein
MNYVHLVVWFRFLECEIQRLEKWEGIQKQDIKSLTAYSIYQRKKDQWKDREMDRNVNGKPVYQKVSEWVEDDGKCCKTK